MRGSSGEGNGAKTAGRDSKWRTAGVRGPGSSALILCLVSEICQILQMPTNFTTCEATSTAYLDSFTRHFYTPPHRRACQPGREDAAVAESSWRVHVFRAEASGR